MLSYFFFPNEAPQLAKKQFFIKLKTNPEGSVNKLAQDINKLVADLDYDYPAGQNKFIISALRELTYYSNIDINGNYYKTYLELCGLIYTVKNDLEKSADNSSKTNYLIDKLSDLALTTYIQDFGNLPGKLAIQDETTDSIYQRLLVFAPITDSLDQDFENAFTALKGAIEYQTTHDLLLSLPKSAIELAETILGNITEASRNDMKLATILLKATTELVQNPYSSEAQAKYYHFSNHAEGTPSIGKKLTVLMLGLLGITMVVSSLFLVAAVAGITSPVSAFFAAVVGHHLIAAAPVLALSGSIAILKVVGLFKDGMRQGLSADMYNLAGLSHQASVERRRSPGLFF